MVSWDNWRIRDMAACELRVTGFRGGLSGRPAPGHPGAWEVSWLPGQLLDRNAAITAMILADIAGSGDLRAGDRRWPHIEGWAAELGLTAPDALARISQPSGRASAEKQDPEPEAAG
jgi:hypothetical protein